MNTCLRIPDRIGERPNTRNGIPHQQLSDNSGGRIYLETRRRFLALPDCDVAPSGISVPGAMALFLPESQPCNDEACLFGREFAHIHPEDDGSFHMCLPHSTCRRVIESGWGEFHPWVELGKLPPTVVMVFGPRVESEIDVVLDLARASRRFAQGSGASLGSLSRELELPAKGTARE